MKRSHTNVPQLLDFCHREVRDVSSEASAKEEARRGDPDGLLRRYAPRNDSLNSRGRWYYSITSQYGSAAEVEK